MAGTRHPGPIRRINPNGMMMIAMIVVNGMEAAQAAKTAGSGAVEIQADLAVDAMEEVMTGDMTDQYQ